MSKLYHAEPVANSLKALIGIKEKGLAFESVYIDLHKFEQQLTKSRWIAGDLYTLADINFFAIGGVALDRLFPELKIATRAPRVADWVGRMNERPAVKAAFAMPNRTNPAFRTFTGEAR